MSAFIKPLQSLYMSVKSAVRRGKSVVIAYPNFTGAYYPDPSFESMCKVLMGDPDVSAAVDFIADVAVGAGFRTSMDENYTEKSDGKTAKEIIDEKCEEFALDILLQEVARDVIAYGNSVIWKGSSGAIEFLARVLPGTIKVFNFEQPENLFLKSVATITGAEFNADEIIWVYTNRSGFTPIGTGILTKLCTSLNTSDGVRPPFAEIKATVQRAMADQIDKFSSYNEVWIFEGIPERDLPRYASLVKEMKKGGRITTNKPAKVIQAVPERMRGLDFYAEMLWNSFYLALATPYPKLILGGGPGFTEASARAAAELGERRILSLQRHLKRIVEREIFDVWIREAGLDPGAAQVRLNWQLQEKPSIETLLNSLEKGRDRGDITREEWRRFMIGLGLDIEEKLEQEE